jgi:hypothetical protein
MYFCGHCSHSMISYPISTMKFSIIQVLTSFAIATTSMADLHLDQEKCSDFALASSNCLASLGFDDNSMNDCVNCMPEAFNAIPDDPCVAMSECASANCGQCAESWDDYFACYAEDMGVGAFCSEEGTSSDAIIAA